MPLSSLPKEQLSPYLRWELASFDERPASAREEAPAGPTPEEIAALHEAARAKGHTDGFTEGIAAGFAEGFAQGMATAQTELAHIQRIGGQFGQEIQQAGDTMSQQLLDLALDVAKAMLKTGLSVRPELVLPVILDAVRYLPNVQQPALLYLNPADAAIARQHIGDELAKTGWRIVEEAPMERGGCRVETASNQIDATTPTRWQRIAAALSRESDWLAGS